MRGFGMLLRPSWTLLDPPGWILGRNIEVKQQINNMSTKMPTGNGTTPCQKITPGTRTTRPQRSLFAQLPHHSPENEVP